MKKNADNALNIFISNAVISFLNHNKAKADATMRDLTIILIVMGIGMVAVSWFLYKDTASYLIKAVPADGIIVTLALQRSTDSNGDTSLTYHPVVRFADKNGHVIEFTSNTGTNPPMYSRDQKVEILYLPSNPHDAKIKSDIKIGNYVNIGFFLIGIGMITTGVTIIYRGRLKLREREYLRKYGRPIETDLMSVELNKNYGVNDRHPFRIHTQWQDPITSNIHIFTSDNLWFDPTKYVNKRTITVFIEKGDPKKYFMDISFLPKLSE